ncbi:MAG: RNA 3'-terminal phosphate cyclase [Phycisphaerales bacterium]
MTNPPIIIDGSRGEGGGQMLRTSLALSMATGRALRMTSIRANRPKPGLMRQHVTAVETAAAVCGAAVAGASVGSAVLDFAPGEVVPGDHEVRIGTAGSTTLVLQTVLCALAFAASPSTIAIEGGTHNPHAPTVDFLRGAFLPALGRMGLLVDVACERPGFYPAGGGRIVARIEPGSPKALGLTQRGAILRGRATAMVAGLPGDIAVREIAVLRERLSSAPGFGGGDDCFRIEHRRDRGPGNVVTIEVEAEGAREVFVGFGAQGVPAEKVAHQAADEALAWIAADVPVGPHLADQLLLPMALAGAGRFTTSSLSPHATTNIEVIERFLAARFHTSELDGRVLVALE